MGKTPFYVLSEDEVREHFSSELNREITDEEFQELKEKFGNAIQDSVADIMAILLHDMKEKN